MAAAWTPVAVASTLVIHASPLVETLRERNHGRVREAHQ
jgi:hypothetical protein